MANVLSDTTSGPPATYVPGGGPNRRQLVLELMNFVLDLINLDVMNFGSYEHRYMLEGPIVPPCPCPPILALVARAVFEYGSARRRSLEITKMPAGGAVQLVHRR